MIPVRLLMCLGLWGMAVPALLAQAPDSARVPERRNRRVPASWQRHERTYTIITRLDTVRVPVDTTQPDRFPELASFYLREVPDTLWQSAWVKDPADPGEVVPDSVPPRLEPINPLRPDVRVRRAEPRVSPIFLPDIAIPLVDTSRLWHTAAYLSLSTNGVGLLNWAAGGESAFSVTGLATGAATYRRNTFNWTTDAELALGVVILQETGFQKTDDRIRITSRAGYRIKGKFNLHGLFDLRTQLLVGFNDPDERVVISRLFSPAYLLLGVGVDYTPGPHFSLSFSPGTGKFTFVLDQELADQGAFGVQAAETQPDGSPRAGTGRLVRPEFGWLFTARYQKEILPNSTFSSHLTLYNNYTDADPNNRLNIDINLDATLTIRINEYITANASLNLIYDHDALVPLFEDVDGVRTQVGTGPRLQFRSSAGVGFAYRYRH